MLLMHVTLIKGHNSNKSIALYILREFKNAPFYMHCLFHMVNLRMFFYHFLSSSTMDHDLLQFRLAHAVYSDLIPTLVFFNNYLLAKVNLIQFENKHFEARCLN